MPEWLWAGIWGFIAGSALLIGAAVGVVFALPKSVVAYVMAFGSGVLISAISFDLMAAAYRRGGFGSTSAGFLGGAAVYSILNWLLSRQGAKDRKRSGDQQPSEEANPGSGMAIAVGALLDGIPESMVIGLSLIGGGSVGLVAVTAIFISNIPEGLSSSAGMKKAGRSSKYIFGLWTGITLISAAASLIGYAACRGASGDFIAAITALAAGAMLAMLADTMMPEAFDDVRSWAGAITVLGFLTAFILTKMGVDLLLAKVRVSQLAMSHRMIILAAAVLAFAACAHREGMVEMQKLDPKIQLDIRYATPNNFTHHAVYDSARCELRDEVARNLVQAEHEFETMGLRLKLFDCYRPLSVQKKFWALLPDDRYVANPAKGSRHNRGAAVDATLVRLSDGTELPMGTGFDDFTERAHRDYMQLPPEVLENRRTFERVMQKHGFVGLPTEWWHFDATNWERYPVEDIPIR